MLQAGIPAGTSRSISSPLLGLILAALAVQFVSDGAIGIWRGAAAF